MFEQPCQRGHLPLNPETLTIENKPFTICITAWFGNSTAGNRKALQRVVRTACHIVGGEHPSLQDIYTRWCTSKGSSRTPATRPTDCTSRLRDSFFPQAIRLMNSKNEYTLQHTPTLQYAMHSTLTQFNWTTRAHCTNTTTYLLPLDTIQCTATTFRIRIMYNLLHLRILLCVYMCT